MIIYLLLSPAQVTIGGLEIFCDLILSLLELRYQFFKDLSSSSLIEKALKVTGWVPFVLSHDDVTHIVEQFLFHLLLVKGKIDLVHWSLTEHLKLRNGRRV